MRAKALTTAGFSRSKGLPWNAISEGLPRVRIEISELIIIDMRIYLDTSVYNRLYDDQSQAKIYLETQAILIILNLIKTQTLESVCSSVLKYENQKNPFPLKQKAITNYFQKAIIKQRTSEAIRQRAKQLENQGIKAIDALHVASFEASQSDYFITCDQRLINRCKSLGIAAINPIDFIKELENEN